MNYQVLVIFLTFLLFIHNAGGIYAENNDSNLENSIPVEEFRTISNSKIHPILIKWQTSEKPNEFAENNNLSFKENKIGVYIHLESADSLPKIPPEINITANDEKIVVAYVNSKQLGELDDLDFVERITPPDIARTPPIPQVEIPKTNTLEENRIDYFVWIIIGGIVIITIVALKKRKKLHD